MQLVKRILDTLYLNAYAILLLVIGVGICFIPFYKISYLFLIVQIPIVFLLLRGSGVILSSWKSKKRSYKILIEKNKKGFCEESFHEYMEAPCGRLLTKLVLRDLEMEDKYTLLKEKYQLTFFNDIKTCNKNAKMELYFNEDFQFVNSNKTQNG